MLSAPSRGRGRILSHSNVLDQTLSQPDQAGDADDQRHQKYASATAIGFCGTGCLCREKHARRNEQVPQDFCIARENVCQQNIPKLPVLHFRQPTHTDSLQRCQKVESASARHALEREDETEQEEEEVGLWEDLPLENGMLGPAGDSPEEEERDGERDSQVRSQTVCRVMMVLRLTRRVSNQCRHIL